MADHGGKALGWCIGSAFVGAVGVLTGVSILAFAAPAGLAIATVHAIRDRSGDSDATGEQANTTNGA